MASRNPGNALAEYGLCIALIVIIAFVSLASLGLAVNSTLKFAGQELSVLQANQTNQLPSGPKAPDALQIVGGQPGSSGSSAGTMPSVNGSLDSLADPHAPVVQTSGSNGDSHQVQGGTTSTPQVSTPVSDGSSSSGSAGNTTPAFVMPVDKTQRSP